ncbi:putative geranylgeranyl pyrophosphate synthetase [Botrytis cinerea]
MLSYKESNYRKRNWDKTSGARGARGGFRQGSASHVLPPVSDKPFGPEIDSIDISTLLIEENAPIIENVNYVASYNWVDGKSPIILVPGSPPAWSPPAQDEKLSEDSGAVYRDINAARYPDYPMEPVVRSLLALEPDFNMQAVDLVACGSTIGNLLRFAGSLEMPFRFDADLVGDTVFFIRKGKSPTETIEDLRGYGHTFPERYTTWDRDVGGSCSHQRIIEYDFADLHLLVRSETDGYLKELEPRASASPKSGGGDAKTSIDELFTKLKVGKATAATKNSKLDLRMQGVKKPQSQIFDMKTRSCFKIFDIEEILPRLWVNQTPNFLIAYHRSGLFNNPQVSSVKDKVLEWEKGHATLLSKFHVLLKRIIEVMRDSKDHRVEISWDGKGPLRVTKHIEEGNRVLPSDLLQEWDDLD